MQINIIEVNKKLRQLGLLYVIWILMGLYVLIFIPPRTIVPGDPAVTAQKILANEFIFRTGIVISIITGAIWVILAHMIYRLFQQVHEKTARLLISFVLVQVPAMFIIEAFSLAALMLFKGDILKSYDESQRQGIAMLFLEINGYASTVLETFWGIWLFPFARLVYRSGFIPRILGIFLLLNGITLIIHSFTTILFPQYQEIVRTVSTPFWVLGEVVFALWALIMGARLSKNNFSKAMS